MPGVVMFIAYKLFTKERDANQKIVDATLDFAAKQIEMEHQTAKDLQERFQAIIDSERARLTAISHSDREHFFRLLEEQKAQIEQQAAQIEELSAQNEYRK